MRLPVIPMPTVWHIGTLDPAMRGGQHSVSYEGAGLSVSNCPRAWRSMASLDGPVLRLDRHDSLWIDLKAVPSDVREAAVAHAVGAGLAEEREVWRAWLWEEGRDEWYSRPFATQAEGTAFTLAYSDTEAWPRPTTLAGHLSALPAKAYPLPCEALGEHVTMPLLTEAGNDRAMGFGRMVDATDILVAFWAEDRLREELPDLVGTWWRERHDPRSDLAPRGAVFPGAVDEFVPTPVEGKDPALSAEPRTTWRDIPEGTPSPRP